MLTTPPSKINLGLHVVARRPDGYHDLETIFYPIPLCDTLEVKPVPHESVPYRLQVVGAPVEGDPSQNLVVKVYESLRIEFNLPPIDIYLCKHIPTGAGLGGGSSDAASMMLMLNQEFRLGLNSDEMRRRLAAFGADCPFFVDASPSYATGIGDQLTPCSVSLRGWILVLVKPPVHVSTRDAYAGITPQHPADDLRRIVSLSPSEWRGRLRNDFEETVFKQHPSIAAIKATLYDMGAVYASMSGSGSAVYALFKRRQENLNKIFQDCFIFQSKLYE